MKYYPLNLNIHNKPVLVVGGGSVALQKVEVLLSASARVTIISPTLHEQLWHYFQKGLIDYKSRLYQVGDLNDFFLAFGATNSRQVNAEILEEARQKKVLFNAVDQPKLCDFIVPARVSRGEFLLTVSTAGEAPFLAKLIRKQLEQLFGEEYGLLSKKIAKIRQLMLKQNRAKEIAPFLQKHWEKMLKHFKKSC